MSPKVLKNLKLRQLDAQLKEWAAMRQRPAITPRKGWIQEIRTALGMSAEQLARRMGVSQPVVARFEQNEVEGAITLKSLRRAAAALDCEVVYALVPRTGLQETVNQRAFEVANRIAHRVSHSMDLEDQGVPGKETAVQVNEIARELIEKRPRALWNEP